MVYKIEIYYIILLSGDFLGRVWEVMSDVQGRVVEIFLGQKGTGNLW